MGRFRPGPRARRAALVTPPIRTRRWRGGRGTGTTPAFVALVERHQSGVVNVAYRLLRGLRQGSQNAAQQGFVQLYLGLRQLSLSRPLRPWLYRIVRNRCIDAIQQAGARSPSTPYGAQKAERGGGGRVGGRAPGRQRPYQDKS